MKIDHKDSFKDFGDQFSKDSKIDEYFGPGDPEYDSLDIDSFNGA